MVAEFEYDIFEEELFPLLSFAGLLFPNMPLHYP